MSQRLAGLSVEEKRKLLVRILKEKVRDTIRAPLSSHQRRIWFLEQLEPGNPAYHICVAVRISGIFNVDAGQRVLNEIVRRHESLRTIFHSDEGEPMQVILPAAPLPLRMIDLSKLAADEQDREIRRWVREEARSPFDLSTGPLIRVTLLRQADDKHVACLTMHHIISDGWSIGVFVGELATLYRAFSQEKTSPLPELPIQYRDFARWQQQKLQGDRLDNLLAYWKGRLQGASQMLDLPTDRVRPAVTNWAGAEKAFLLPLALCNSLKELSRQEGVTLFMILLAAFSALLYRFTGQDDILIATPISWRERPETRALIGALINTLVLRINLSGDPPFRQLLKRVQDTALGAYAHQDLPFDKLVEALQPPRNLGRTPLVQVMFVHQNFPVPPLEYPGLSIRLLDIDPGIAQFELTLETFGHSDEIRGRFRYKTDLFGGDTMARLAEHFQTLLEGAAADPELRLSELPLLTEAERQQVLIEWNQTQAEYPRQACIHELFEAQAARTPEAVAVVYEDQRLTYGELNTRANQLAHHLRSLGVGPEALVGICLERSLELVVGLLGILKAGGAYVPLDPSYPKERLAFLLEDIRSSVLLTRRAFLERLPDHGARIVCLDTFHPQGGPEPCLDCNPQSGVSPHTLAYVLYTSGSTGQPKGVMVEHRSLLNYLCWVNERLLPDQDLCLPLVTNPTFDACLKQLFAPLLRGNFVWILPPEIAAHPLELIRVLSERKKTALNCVPSLWAAILEQISAGRQATSLAGLTHLFLGGEPVTRDLLNRTLAALPHLQIWNLYGPTEATANASAGAALSGDRVTIGRPIANTSIYILDAQLQPVPVGVPGDMHIGGVCLARGYLNRPKLTAEKFIPHPLTEEPGARLYRTGDRARFLPDGNIEFLGRLDHQVKIRGFRIELGEIEAVLKQHPMIREAVVLDREDDQGHKRLVAYWAAAQGTTCSPIDLRQFLAEKLPGYMIPSAFVRLDAVPLTTDGKLDRRALSAPQCSAGDLEASYVAPRTPSEAVMAGVWAEVLGRRPVGIHDNFFQLGGDSLKGMQLLSRISTAMGREIPVKFLFMHPTIATLAEAIAAGNKPSQSPPPPAGGVFRYRVGEGSAVLPSSPFQKIERRPLLSLFAAGQIAAVEAAALGYLPSEILTSTGLSRDEIIHEWCDDLPILACIFETQLGRIAAILLPRFSFELYQDQSDLVEVVVEALEMAGRLGARTVSLTGLIPSATDYGRAIAARTAGRNDLPRISTGHATTTASVVLTIRKILRESGRDLTQERVGFLGLGSVGMASLRLTLKRLPHPAEIILCDTYAKRDMLEALKQELRDEMGYCGSVSVLASPAEVPQEFYDATLIIGAANIGGILDVDRIRTRTVIVDDSAPHCFVPERAIKRLQERRDILFSEGGVLRSPHPIHQLAYVPRSAEHLIAAIQVGAVTTYNPFAITGCVLSSLLSSRFEDLEPTVGLVDVGMSSQHYDMLMRQGFDAADLHCGNYVLPAAAIRDFRHLQSMRPRP